jgi:hypothetical protein
MNGEGYRKFLFVVGVVKDMSLALTQPRMNLDVVDLMKENEWKWL